MNRGVEARSDLYSFGATLYFLLTGRAPFQSSDPLALIHAHMARVAVSPAEVRPELGQGLARVVLRLLNKQPEARYASARSLLDDLRRCQHELATRGAIADTFRIGTSEAPEGPRFARKLYGREREIETLQRAVESAAEGRLHALLIRGEPGSGKSALLDAVRAPLSQRRGYLAAGKFEQYGERPYAGWIAALESFTHQLLVESDASLQRWRTQLLEGLGSIAAALTEIVPDLALVLGEVPAVPPLGGRESLARLSLAIQRCFQACATRDHPLVLFLDDVQWADPGSRFILDELLSERTRGAAILVIGASRRQIDPAVATSIERCFTAVPSASSDPTLLELGPLSPEASAQMLADALGQDLRAVMPLARLVDRKTGGVPFLIQQFVDHICDRGMLRYSPPAGWTWDEGQLSGATIPEGAVDLLIARFERLSPAAHRLLELASCVGDSFDLGLLSQLSDRDARLLQPSLYALADAGLVTPCDSGFRFAHDRIREAAQSLLSEAQRAALHYDLGRRLLEQLDPAARTARAREIAGHLGRGIELLPVTLRPAAVEINLLAAKQALAAGASASAAGYLAVARGLFGEQDWLERRAVGFELHLQSAETAFNTGDPSAALGILDALEARTPSLIEFARIAVKRMQVNALIQPPEPCMRYVLSVLRRFGVRWPLRPSRLRVRLELLRVRCMLRKRHGRDMFRRATSVDPQWTALVMVLGASASTTSRFNYGFSILMNALVMRRNIRYGYVARPAFTLSSYITQAYHVLRDAEDARRRSADLLALEEQEHDSIYGPRTRLHRHAILHPWLMRRREALDPLESVTQCFRELGDSEYAYYARFMYIYYRAIAGDPLAETEARLRDLVALVERTVHLYRAPRGCLDAFVTLREGDPDEVERSMAGREPELAADTSGEPYRRTAWLIVLSVFDRQEAAFAQSEALGDRLFQVSPYVHVADHLLHRGIAASALATARSREARGYRRALQACRRSLHRYAKDGPDFLHMAQLLDAERARLRGDEANALALYRRAAQRAIQQGFPHHGALAHERRGRMLLEQRRATEAATAFSDALVHYRDWGADAKVRTLELERTDLLQ
jgi:hypothetical protein